MLGAITNSSSWPPSRPRHNAVPPTPPQLPPPVQVGRHHELAPTLHSHTPLAPYPSVQQQAHQCRLGAMTNSSSWPPPRSSLSPPFTARSLNVLGAGRRYVMVSHDVVRGGKRGGGCLHCTWFPAACAQPRSLRTNTHKHKHHHHSPPPPERQPLEEVDAQSCPTPLAALHAPLPAPLQPPPHLSVSPLRKLMHTLLPTTVASGNRSSTWGPGLGQVVSHPAWHSQGPRPRRRGARTPQALNSM